MSDVIVPMWTLGDRLAKARDTALISVQRMAVELGVSRNTVTNYEHGRTEPPLAVVKVYAQETGVPLWWLLGEDPGDGTVDRRASRSTKWESTPWRGELPVTLKMAA